MLNFFFFFKLYDFSISALAKWFLLVCLNIHSIELECLRPPPISFHNEIGLLKKLKKLSIWDDDTSELKEVR